MIITALRCIFYFVLSASTACFGAVIGRCDHSLCTIGISGPITKSDVRKVINERNRLTKKFPQIFSISYSLDSPGGDLYAAFELGRFIRRDKKSAKTVVAQSAKCASACVFVLAAGIHKWTFGDVIIHRPYLGEVGDLSTEFIKKQHTQVKLDAESYLAEMNIPIGLYDLMYSIAPEDSYFLSPEELSGFFLTGIDPIEAERIQASRAARVGLTRQRLMELEKFCSSLAPSMPITNESLTKWADCDSQIESGQLK